MQFVFLPSIGDTRCSFCSIHLIVGEVCVKIWVTKIISEFHNYIQAGKDGVAKRCKALTDAMEGIITTNIS